MTVVNGKASQKDGKLEDKHLLSFLENFENLVKAYIAAMDIASGVVGNMYHPVSMAPPPAALQLNGFQTTCFDLIHDSC